MSTKTVYDEAIADVKKLKELAESRARDAVLQKVEPQLKRLVEQHLFEGYDFDEDDCDHDFADGDVCSKCDALEEACGVGAAQGMIADEANEETQYEVSEGTETGLTQLADFAQPVTDDRFAVEVYRMQEDIQRLVVSNRKEKLSEEFSSKLEEAISKLEDMYAYLRESYAGNDRTAIEGKLEKGYGLINAVKESTMKMRDLLNEEDLTVKINNLPDGVDPDAITIDVVADEADEDGGMPADMGAAPAADAAPPFPTAEGDEGDDDEEVLEISEADLKAELSRLHGLRESDAVPPTKGHGGTNIDDFGDAHSEGEPFDDDVSDLENIAEADVKMESARQRLARSARRLSESRGTDREDFARAMYKSAVKSYRSVRALHEASAKKNSPAANVKNTSDSKRLAEANSKVDVLTKQLAESNLLNAKLIHANKLLRLEGLTKAQQAMVIDRLDEARNLREVRLISENIKAMLVGSKGSVNESVARRPSGSASRPSRTGTASPQPLTEGLETARWAQLAGLK